MEPKAALGWVIALFAVPGGLWLWTAWPTLTALRICESELQDKLKAPSTYRRIEYSDYGDKIFITYDAENSFGAPLRSEGYCIMNADRSAAVWRE